MKQRLSKQKSSSGYENTTYSFLLDIFPRKYKTKHKMLWIPSKSVPLIRHKAYHRYWYTFQSDFIKKWYTFQPDKKGWMPNMKKVRVRCKKCGRYLIDLEIEGNTKGRWKCKKCGEENNISVSDKIIENTQLKC